MDGLTQLISPQLGEIYPQYSEAFESMYVSNNLCQVASGRSKNDVFLNYSLYGQGPKKLFFIMGLTATSSYWVFQAKYFGSLPEYQVCIFDNRGIGFSSVTPGPYTTKMLALDGLELLNYLGWTEQIHLIGVSMGGMVAQMMTILRPEIFTSACFTSTYNSSFLVVPTSSNFQIFYKLFSLSRQKLVRPLLKLCFPKPWLKEHFDSEATNYELLEQTLLRLCEANPCQDMSGDYSQLMAALMHNVPPGKLKKISGNGIRCLVVHGSKDKVIRPYCGSLLASFLSCPLVIFRNSGHMLMIEREQEFNTILRAHVENLPIKTYLEHQSYTPSYVTGKHNAEPLIFTKGSATQSEQDDTQYINYKPEEARAWSLLSTLKSTIYNKRPSAESRNSKGSLEEIPRKTKSSSAEIPRKNQSSSIEVPRKNKSFSVEISRNSSEEQAMNLDSPPSHSPSKKRASQPSEVPPASRFRLLRSISSHIPTKLTPQFSFLNKFGKISKERWTTVL